MKKRRIIAILIALTMVLTYMPSMVFAKEAVSVTGVSYTPDTVTVEKSQITVTDDQGNTHLYLEKRHIWNEAKGQYYFFAEGEKITLTFSDGSTQTYTCKYVESPDSAGYYDAWFVSDEDPNVKIWPDEYPYNGNYPVPLQDGLNPNFYWFEFNGVRGYVSVYLDSPEQREKVAAEQRRIEAEKRRIANNGELDPSLPAVKIKKPSASKKSFTAKWKKLNKKKQQKYVNGIEVEYSLTPDFSSGNTFKAVGKKKASVKVKKLKPKQVYYVRAHTYVVKGGVKYVSNWSATKKVKVK